MAAKLKLILRRILSSLALKAVIFALAWFILPFWLFLLVAFYLFFTPLFRAWSLLLPFFTMIFFAAIEPPNFFMAALFAFVFYLILGLKELVFIDHKGFEEILVLLLLFLMLINFFSKFDGWPSGATFFCSFAVSVVFFFLVKKFIGEHVRNGSNYKFAATPNSDAIIPAIPSFVLWQTSIAALFLPLNFFYQTAIVFLVGAISLELISDYASGELTRKRLLLIFSIFMIFLTMVLGSAQWGL